LSSPVEARVLRVLKRAGQSVSSGEPIVELDTSELRLQLEQLEDALARKRNEQEQLRLGLQRSLDSLDGRLQSAQADLEVLEFRARQKTKLRTQGLLSEEELLQAQAELKKGRIDVAQLQLSMTDERRSTEAQLEGLALDLGSLGKQRDQLRRQLEQATGQ